MKLMKRLGGIAISKRKYCISILFVLVLLLTACSSEEECKKPMTQLGDKCCVDLDDNKICDLEEETIIEEAPLEKPVITVESSPKEEKTEITQKQSNEPLITSQVTAEITEEPMVKIESPQQPPTPASETYQFIELYEKNSFGYQYLSKGNWNKIKGNRIKREMDIPKKFHSIEINGKKYSLFLVDTVYLDKNTQQATGYCEKDQSCYSEELLDVRLKLDYDEYKDKTPDEWLYEYAPKKPDLFEERKYYVKSRLTSRATYKTETGELRIYFDPKTGLPVRIEERLGEHPLEITEYFELTAGTVKDTDVIHRSRFEISPEDIFYTTRQ